MARNPPPHGRQTAPALPPAALTSAPIGSAAATADPAASSHPAGGPAAPARPSRRRTARRADGTGFDRASTPAATSAASISASTRAISTWSRR